MADFKTSLALLAEWGAFLKKEEKDLDAKLAKQGGSGDETSPPDIQVEEDILTGEAPSAQAAVKPAAPANDDDWMDELMDDDDSGENEATTPTLQPSTTPSTEPAKPDAPVTF